MNFKTTSRKDDMISLCLNLFCLLNNFKYPFLENIDLTTINQQDVHIFEKFKIMKDYKEKNNLVRISENLNEMKLI